MYFLGINYKDVLSGKRKAALIQAASAYYSVLEILLITPPMNARLILHKRRAGVHGTGRKIAG